MRCTISSQLTCPYTSRSTIRPRLGPVHAGGNESTRAPEDFLKKLRSVHFGTLVAASSWTLSIGAAFAKDREYGILEGTSLALVHPAVMIGLFGATLYAGYLGWQWRRLREVGAEIKELRKQAPKPEEDGSIPDSPILTQIKELETTRKELAAGGFRDRHYDLGSILLGGGTSIAVFGCVNTYTRTGKLFPGPHLFAGAGIVVLWAVAASLVPSMQKGNENARTAHIALNALNVLLFASQIPTGFEIIGKVFEFTTFP